MDMRLAENIRQCRHQLGLTQERLAGVLGVTVGAVYKWEAGLSTPELTMLIELADFFDTSLDALIGYELKDNRQKATADRLLLCLRQKDASGLAEAEKALKKYPYSFDVVYRSAGLYQVLGLQSRDRALLRRSVELYEAARPLLSQSSDPRIGEISLSGEIAVALMVLEENDKGLELLQKNNVNGVFNDLIGLTLASDARRFEEASLPLSEALVDAMVSLTRVVFGYINVYFKRKEERRALELLPWAIAVLSGLKEGEKSSFFDKTVCLLYACLAFAQLKTGSREEAARSLHSACALAVTFDRSPDYRVQSLRFVSGGLEAAAHDDIGGTALEGLEKAVAQFEDEALAGLWEEACRHAE